MLKVFLKTVSKVTQRPGSYLSPPPLPLGRCADQNDSVPELGPGHASGPSGQRQSDASAGEKSSPSPASGPTRGQLRWLAVTPQPGAPRRLRGVDAGSSRRHSPTATLRHPRPTLCRAKVTCPLVSSAPRPPDGRSSQAGRQRGSDSTCVPEASFPAPPPPPALDPIPVDTGGSETPGGGSDGWTCRTSRGLGRAGPASPVPHSLSHLRPAQKVAAAHLLAAANTLGRARGGCHGCPPPQSRSPAQPCGAVGGTQPQPRLHCTPLKLPWRSAKEGADPHLAPGPLPLKRKGSDLGPASETPAREGGSRYCPGLVKQGPFRPCSSHPGLRGAAAQCAGWRGHAGLLCP